MKQFLQEIFRQIFGYQNPRSGKLRLTRYALQRMHEWQLDINTLEDTFRYGDEVKKEMIIRKYRNYSVGLTYKFDSADEQFVIITCWLHSSILYKRFCN
jgi:hypothetical protein